MEIGREGTWDQRRSPKFHGAESFVTSAELPRTHLSRVRAFARDIDSGAGARVRRVSPMLVIKIG